MSYCRFSSDNWRSDIYCFEHYEGYFATYVAANRVVGDIPEVPCIDGTPVEEWVAANRAQMEWLETCQREAIGLPHDGEAFQDPDLPSFLARLEHLKAVGYHLPDWVLDNVRAEIAEAS